MERKHLQSFDVSWGHEPGCQRAADVPSADRFQNCRQDAGSTLRFMESEERRGRCLIEPMNLRDSNSVAVACSVAARDSGAFVPVGKIGSDIRQHDCLVTPVEVFPLGRFAFSVWCVGRVGGGPNLRRCSPPPARGEGVVLFISGSPNSDSSKKPNILSTSCDERFMGSLHFFETHWDQEPADRAVASWSAVLLHRFLAWAMERVLPHWRKRALP